MTLRDKGLFSWGEWAERLGAERAKRGAKEIAGDADAYYLDWLSALESLVADKGAASMSELLELKGAWDRAARATPHGKPIILGAGGPG